MESLLRPLAKPRNIEAILSAVRASSTHASATTTTKGTRTETDLLGHLEVPDDALYGIQTLRAKYNYPVTGIPLSHHPELVKALGMVKKAALTANHSLGLLDMEKANPIRQACDEVIAGEHNGHFIVDMIQGGAGTSTNMNANEVIANRALEIAGYSRGDYSFINPNDEVNLCQSTNDVYPTACKLAIVFKHYRLVNEIEELINSLNRKAEEFSDVIKMGRTQLCDAVPLFLGDEFRAFSETFARDLEVLRHAVDRMYEVHLGGTAIGTGIAADERFSEASIATLSALTRLPLYPPKDMIEATWSTGAFHLTSGVLRRYATKLSKVSNDLRLLSSGPRCGINEINLPAVAPGSSIMPGKVNPVIPECINQICFQVIGADTTITMACEGGQLQLNPFEPIIMYNLLQSLDMLERGAKVFRTRCIDGITANRERCDNYVRNSIGIVTALLPVLGYKNASKVAKYAQEHEVSVSEAALALDMMTEEQLHEWLDPKAMTSNKSSSMRFDIEGTMSNDE